MAQLDSYSALTGIDGDELIFVQDDPDGTPSDATVTPTVLHANLPKLDEANAFTGGGANSFSGKVGVNDDDPSEQLAVVAGSTSTKILKLDAAVGATAAAWDVRYNDASRINAIAFSNSTSLILENADLTASTTGPYVQIGYNSNAAPTPGTLRFKDIGGTTRIFWASSNGIFRVAGGFPTNANEITYGAAVGDQTGTSNEKSKTISGGQQSTAQDASARLAAAEKDIRHFTFTDGRYGDEVFESLVLFNGAGRHPYGKHATEEQDAGQFLNSGPWLSDLTRVVNHLNGRVKQLESTVADLRSEIDQLKGSAKHG